jgi:cytoskeletal protein CcmA (bactofilin family)
MRGENWMAISSFGRGEKGGSDPAMPAAAGGTNLSAFIDQGSEFEGKLTFKDTVRIDGCFRGEISSENTLIVGETGSIEATIRSNTVVVSGSVEGNIVAGHQVVLHKTARVHGDMSAPSLIIEEGAKFNGQISMGRSEAKSASGGTPLKSIPGGGSKPSGSPGPNGGGAPSS